MRRSRARECAKTGGRGSAPGPRSRLPRNFVAATLFALTLALVVVLGGAQAQTGPPSVDGEGAREVTDTTALLAGYVNPNGGHTTYRFEYGLDTN